MAASFQNQYIFDSGPLITSCKFSVTGRLVLDHILSRCAVTIPASVSYEVTVAGNRYPDARAAQQRISNAQIAVVSPPAVPDLERLIAPYGLGHGERDSILLTSLSDFQGATVVIDDHLACLVSDRLGVGKRFLLDVIADLAKAGEFDRRLAENIVLAIQARYPAAFVAHTLLLIRR
jgi:hypothetical protein